MIYKFKKNQIVKFIINVDFTDTGGPFIRKGASATVIKRIRGENSVWVKSDDFGIHRISTDYLANA